MKISRLLSIVLLLALPLTAMAEGDENEWNATLRNQYFSGKTITESSDVIELEAPYRAEDPALVPLKIVSKIPQTQDIYIRKILVLVDKNPFPFVGEFELTPDSGKADLAMRVRVNTYSYIRAIAEMNDGRLIMTKKFVKASGGCSAPIGADLDASMKRLGKMKFRLDGGVKAGEPNLAQLLISHPNITGMQMDQLTRFVKKSHFIEQLKVTFNGKPVLTAKTDIAISSDPNFRFYFVPQSAGVLKAEISDTSCESPTARDACTKGSTYSESYQVEL
ncbi:quinoprotein dehydrogenase-associated SoxYZ-like carrier [Candidatus Methylomicrobium oryzae]|jgi:sulfur-oxidizing protein SoxY|uniref:quinoprotein dehydrogenase-associated SoxYZ-like carrier n=1 Tax=Candidatus Methylomicrobium oryzae TaxID=2802053 RepID=UPI0019232DFB|nr:quinoprotein dehydrogenase-associated SoxYZ-like carrier [Methylomicrobium sp. RS1]MBL1263601.1 quinoprotein dehydrogenase-associated SoxYZ-like carrier [Methylomicrobium sp. RS1]